MRIALSVIVVLVLVAGLVGLGVAVYQAGYTQGAVQSGSVEAPNTVVMPYPHYGPYWGPWGFGFGCFGLFFVFFAIFALTRLLFGPRHWGWRGGYGPWGRRGFNGDQVPPQVDELHRRMHETMNQPPTAQA